MRVARPRVVVLVVVLELMLRTSRRCECGVSASPLATWTSEPSTCTDDVRGEGRGGGTTYRLANAVVRVGVTVGDVAMGGMT